MFTDSHCHLNYPEFVSDMQRVRSEMQAAKVSKALVISTKMETFAQVHSIANAYDNFWCTVGVHPDEENVQEPSTEDLIDKAALPKVVGIGETGLDYYRLAGRSILDMEWQRERFRNHIRAARAVRLPLVIHTRSASEDTLNILQEEGENGSEGSVGGVFHCFTENEYVAKRALELGFYISFSGIVTFKNAVELQKIASWLPSERLLIETDSPYLAPMPHRGKQNSPAYVPYVAQKIAQLRGISVEEVAKISSDNFERLFERIHEQ
jgi:TatD DNase family protein